MAERKWESIPDGRSSKGEGPGAYSGEADAGCSEAERVKGRAEGSGGLVGVEAFREIDRGGVFDAFVTEEAELVGYSLVHRKPM